MHSLPAASPSSCASLKLRLLASAMEACGDSEAEEARYEQLSDRYQSLQELVFERPVRSWADVIEIAEIAHFWSDKTLENELMDLESDDVVERSTAVLILAVLRMAKGGDNV